MSQEVFKDEGQFRLIVDAAPNGMLLVDTSGTIVMANACVLSLFGYRREALIGQPVEMLLPVQRRAAHPAQRAEFFTHLKARSMGGGKELFGLRQDGTVLPDGATLQRLADLVVDALPLGHVAGQGGVTSGKMDHRVRSDAHRFEFSHPEGGGLVVSVRIPFRTEIKK